MWSHRRVSALKRTLRQWLRSGDADVPHECVLGSLDPQRQVRVLLRTPGAVIDVTDRHTLASATPFRLAIGLVTPEQVKPGDRFSLQFLSWDVGENLLAEMSIECEGAWEGAPHIALFRALAFRNHCLPFWDFWRQRAFFTYRNWRRKGTAVPETAPTPFEFHCVTTLFVCPRPVMLVSVRQGSRYNMFPMNLAGSAPDGHFLFALNRHRKAAPLVREAGRLALCSVPVEQAAEVRALGGNHRLDSIAEDSLRFPLRRSPSYGLPVPAFSTRLREVEVLATRDLGSHEFFVGKVTHEERWEQRAEFFMIHGFYEIWRRRQGLT